MKIVPAEKVPWMDQVAQMKANLAHRRNHAVSSISAHRFVRRIKNFEDEDGPHWTVGMKSYTLAGESMAKQYKLLSGPKKLTLQDFLVHYTQEFHITTFSKREQHAVNVLILYDNNSVHPVKPEIIQIVVNPQVDYMDERQRFDLSDGRVSK
jgi:hypothetical protein